MALAQQRPETKHLEEVKTGLAGWRESGADLLVPYILGVLAQTHWVLGNLDEARLAITEALTLTEKSSERWSEAELHRLQGEFRSGGQEQLYLEGQAALCVPEEDGGTHSALRQPRRSGSGTTQRCPGSSLSCS